MLMKISLAGLTNISIFTLRRICNYNFNITAYEDYLHWQKLC